MKRAINCLAMLMFAFVVTFGFQAHAAHAQPSSSVNFICELDLNNYCSQTIPTGQTLGVIFDPHRTLSVTAGNLISTDPTTRSRISPMIGTVPGQSFEIVAGQVQSRQYSISNFTMATFRNNSDTQGSSVRLLVSLWR